jgi:hypothetical protein
MSRRIHGPLSIRGGKLAQSRWLGKAWQEASRSAPFQSDLVGVLIETRHELIRSSDQIAWSSTW